MSDEKEWPWVMGLAAAGALDSLYLLLFQTGKVKRLVCPAFGSGCEQVAGSPHAFPARIPDAVFGVAGYTAAGLTAAAISRTTGEARRTLAKTALAGSAAALGLSAYLTYAQPKRTGAWCFWCLLSAVTSAAMAAVSISGARKVLRQT